MTNISGQIQALQPPRWHTLRGLFTPIKILKSSELDKIGAETVGPFRSFLMIRSLRCWGSRNLRGERYGVRSTCLAYRKPGPAVRLHQGTKEPHFSGIAERVNATDEYYLLVVPLSRFTDAVPSAHPNNSSALTSPISLPIEPQVILSSQISRLPSLIAHPFSLHCLHR